MDKETVDAARREAGEAYIVFAEAMKVYEAASIDWLRKKGRFQELDHQLAMSDGRLKVVPPRQRKDVKQPELTLGQIMSIASALNIKVTEEEEEEENAEEV